MGRNGSFGMCWKERCEMRMGECGWNEVKTIDIFLVVLQMALEFS